MLHIHRATKNIVPNEFLALFEAHSRLINPVQTSPVEGYLNNILS